MRKTPAYDYLVIILKKRDPATFGMCKDPFITGTNSAFVNWLIQGFFHVTAMLFFFRQRHRRHAHLSRSHDKLVGLLAHSLKQARAIPKRKPFDSKVREGEKRFPNNYLTSCRELRVLVKHNLIIST